MTKPSKSKVAAKKSSTPKQLASTKPRRVKTPQYRSLRLSKRIKHPVKLPSVWKLTKQAALTIWRHRRLFFGITLTYGLLTLILVQGLATKDVGHLKNQLNQIFTGHFGQLSSSLTVFLVLVSSAGNNSSPTAAAYQFFLLLITSLAVIWALRQVMAGQQARVRDAYYKGIYPLVPFILVLGVVGLQLIPLMVGAQLYGLVTSTGIAVFAAEKFLWGLLFLLLALLSLYMLCSSLFALYIVTLPDMTPLKALRSARELVRHRRWTVLRKVLFLPIVLLLAAAAIMLPIIIWLTPLAQWTFFLLSMLGLVAVHAYMYNLYRELLNE
ncbi:MAG TPA: hypothetical protein VLG37_00525 [Candidatus Saccharimonadales bacterium]|nr:hypothetical protein [Candidatus Saccharimonadales bacterium]